MRNVIETVQDAIFDKKEVLKKITQEKEDLLNRLCEKQNQIKNFKDKIQSLEIDLKVLYEIEHKSNDSMKYGAQNGCNLSPTMGTSDCIKQSN